MKHFILIIYVIVHITTEIKGERIKRVVGGELINIKDAPYMIALEYMNRQICGGAILNKKWVLTAAHCFGNYFYADRAIVRAGTDLRQRGGSIHYILSIFTYPHFQLSVVDNDVGLIQVYPNLFFSNTVQPIRLRSESTPPRVGEMLTALGWGYTEENGKASNHLRSVSMPVFPHEECKEIYKTTINITQQMLCVGFMKGGRDACILDSGGPLVMNDTIVGLVSWGWGCARALRPGVYTSLSSPQVRNWILNTIRNKKSFVIENTV